MFSEIKKLYKKVKFKNNLGININLDNNIFKFWIYLSWCN